MIYQESLNLFTKKEYEEKFPDYPDAPILSDDISNFILLFLSNREFVTHINYPFTYPNIKTNSKKFIKRFIFITLKLLR
jgi:hypothetical protein